MTKVSTGMIELYHSGMSTCSQKVRLVLEEKSIPWQSREINLATGEQRLPAYLKINPNGVVPALVVDGCTIIESTLINEYLDEGFASEPLRPSDLFERARMRLWAKRVDEELHWANATLTIATIARRGWLARPNADVVAEISQSSPAALRATKLSILAQGTDAPEFMEAVRRVVRFFYDINEALENRTWLCGEQFSLADCAIAPYVIRFYHLGLSPLLSSGPLQRVDVWHEMLAARPSYEVAIERWTSAPFLKLFQNAGSEIGSAAERAIRELGVKA